MRRALIIFLLFMLAGAWGLQFVEQDSGYVLIAFGQTSVEMSLWLALLLVFGGAFLLWLLWSLLRGSVSVTRRVSGQLFFGSRERARARTARGLIDFIEGNWKQARKKLIKAAPRADQPMINYLAAARCAFELGDRKDALTLLHEAEKSSEGSELAVALTQARMQLQAQRYEQCLATLQRVHRLAPQHPVILDLLRQVYIALSDWASLAGLLDSLRAYGNLGTEELRQLELTIYREQLRQVRENPRRLPPDEQYQALRKVWQKVPGALQKQPDLVQVYVDQLVALGKADDAEQVLRKVLPKSWHQGLVRQYGTLVTKDPAHALLVAEGWLKQRPADATLMLTIGRLCLRNEQWGRAREYFQSSLQLAKDPEACGELARLLANLGEHEKSTHYYQEGLRLTTQPLPELPQPRAARHTVSPRRATS